jgi:Leucine-rich repeat (LRR) protein
MKKRLLCSALILAALLCLAACHSAPAEAPPAASTTAEPPAIVDGVAIQWKEPALEALVRHELGKPEGTIYQEELDYVECIELYGVSHLFINPTDGYMHLKKGKDIDLHNSDSHGNVRKDGTYEIERREYTRGSISCLTDFVNFRNLKVLFVFKNSLTSLSGLSSLQKLTDLFLWDDDIHDAGALANLTQLKNLDISYNNIADMPAFSDFDQIISLGVDGNYISSLEWLDGFSSVGWLSLGHNPLLSLEGLEKLQNLESLTLVATQAEDMSVLAGNSYLRILNLKNMKLKSFDLVQLTAIPNLEILTISQAQTELENFRSLADMEILENLYITPNVNISDEEIAWLKEQLPYCSIE